MSKNTVVARNSYMPNLPKDTPSLKSISVTLRVSSVKAQSDGSVQVQVCTDRLALFVFLSTRSPGRFTENAFNLDSSECRSVKFHSWDKKGTVDVDEFKQTLRVQHLGSFYRDNASPTSVEKS